MNFGVRKYWKIWSSALLLVVLTVIYFGFHYRAHVSSAFGWISEETGGKTMAVLTIALSLLALVYGLFCLIFPIIVFVRLNDLRRRVNEVAQNVEMLDRQSPNEKPQELQNLREK